MTLNRQQLQAARKGLVCIERGTKIPGSVLAKVPAEALEAASAAAGVLVRIFPEGVLREARRERLDRQLVSASG